MSKKQDQIRTFLKKFWRLPMQLLPIEILTLGKHWLFLFFLIKHKADYTGLIGAAMMEYSTEKFSRLSGKQGEGGTQHITLLSRQRQTRNRASNRDSLRENYKFYQKRSWTMSCRIFFCTCWCWFYLSTGYYIYFYSSLNRPLTRKFKENIQNSNIVKVNWVRMGALGQFKGKSMTKICHRSFDVWIVYVEETLWG